MDGQIFISNQLKSNECKGRCVVKSIKSDPTAKQGLVRDNTESTLGIIDTMVNKLLICEFCDRVYKRVKELIEHKKNIHGIPINSVAYHHIEVNATDKMFNNSYYINTNNNQARAKLERKSSMACRAKISQIFKAEYADVDSASDIRSRKVIAKPVKYLNKKCANNVGTGTHQSTQQTEGFRDIISSFNQRLDFDKLCNTLTKENKSVNSTRSDSALKQVLTRDGYSGSILGIDFKVNNLLICEFCDKFYNRKTALLEHRKNVHGIPFNSVLNQQIHTLSSDKILNNSYYNGSTNDKSLENNPKRKLERISSTACKNNNSLLYKRQYAVKDSKSGLISDKNLAKHVKDASKKCEINVQAGTFKDSRDAIASFNQKYSTNHVQLKKAMTKQNKPVICSTFESIRSDAAPIDSVLNQHIEAHPHATDKPFDNSSNDNTKDKSLKNQSKAELESTSSMACRNIISIPCKTQYPVEDSESVFRSDKNPAKHVKDVNKNCENNVEDGTYGGIKASLIRKSSDVELNKTLTKQNNSLIGLIPDKDVSCELGLQVRQNKINSIKDSPHTCTQCGKAWECKSALKRHILTHSDERNFSCNHCENKYKTKKTLETHLKNISERHVCDKCGKELCDKYSLSDHKKTFHVEQRTPCEKCGKLFQSQKSLSRHMANVHDKISITTFCDVCHKVFATKHLMKKHYDRLHNVGKVFICNDCQAVFKYRLGLITHIKTFHLPPTLECSICSKMLPTDQSLRYHIRLAHGVDNRRNHFLCPDCGKCFRSKNVLKMHEIIHTGKKPYVCEQCGKCFRTDSNLHQHAQIHLEARPFKCNVCDKGFRIKHHLKQHMATHGMASVPKYGKRGKNYLTTKIND